jgi:glycosyltransferase involved in cell wall biosynthesis
LKIVWLIHAYPPKHNAGAEWMAVDMNRYLSKHHDVHVIADFDGEFEGINVSDFQNRAVTYGLLDQADIVLTHLGLSGMAWNRRQPQRKPVVFVAHNTNRYHFCNQSPCFVVYNAEWVKRTMNYSRPSVVLPPPTYPNQWKRTAPGEYITLVNRNESKGGKLLADLARRMPERKFLAVTGGYGQQWDDYPDNVTIHPNTTNMQAVYDMSRIVLMPSEYESWGRVAIEASACGRPVIAHPTPGLLESLGSAGIFARRDQLEQYVEAIGLLDDENAYITASNRARERAEALSPEPQLERLNEFLNAIYHRSIT